MPVRHFKSSRSQAAKKEIHKEAKRLMDSRGLSAKDAHGVATKIVTGRGPKKKKK